jgi:hypothetical protein
MQNERPRLNLENRAFQLAINPGVVPRPMEITEESPQNVQDYLLLNNGDGFKYYSSGILEYLPTERLPFDQFVLLVIGSNNKRYPLHKDRLDRIYVTIKKNKIYLFIDGSSITGMSLDQTTEFFTGKVIVLERKMDNSNNNNRELPDFTTLTVDPLTGLTMDLSRIRPVAQKKRRLTEAQRLLQADETRRGLEIYNDLQEENEDLENEHYAEFPLLKKRRNGFGAFSIKKIKKIEKYLKGL